MNALFQRWAATSNWRDWIGPAIAFVAAATMGLCTGQDWWQPATMSAICVFFYQAGRVVEARQGASVMLRGMVTDIEAHKRVLTLALMYKSLRERHFRMTGEIYEGDLGDDDVTRTYQA